MMKRFNLSMTLIRMASDFEEESKQAKTHTKESFKHLAAKETLKRGLLQMLMI